MGANEGVREYYGGTCGCEGVLWGTHEGVREYHGGT